MSQKSSYHHGDLRSALLDAGDEVLAEKGMRGFTLRECARRAGVSHAAPKHHFEDVRGLLTALAARGFERLCERLRSEMAFATNLAEEFEATTRAYVGFAEDFPEHFRIMFRSDLLDADSDDLVQAVKGTFVVLTNVILRQRGEPEISSLEETKGGSDQSFKSIIDDIIIGWCHIHGFAHLRLEQQLKMVPGDDEQQVMGRAAKRLSGLLSAG